MVLFQHIISIKDERVIEARALASASGRASAKAATGGGTWRLSGHRTLHDLFLPGWLGLNLLRALIVEAFDIGTDVEVI